VFVHKCGTAPLQPTDCSHFQKGQAVIYQSLYDESCRQSSDMPAASAQAPEYRLICRIGIQMIRLRIKP